MKLKIIIIAFLCIGKIQCQNTIKSVSSFFPNNKAEILVVGTFHFDYPNIDVAKTDVFNRIDVLKEPKKSEVSELVAYIKKFKPTKIAIEAFPKWNATGKLKEYKNGKHLNQRDERYQLAMRIAKEMKLDTLYSVDSESMLDDLSEIDSLYVKTLTKEFDFKSDDIFFSYVNEWWDYEHKLPTKTKLLDYFQFMNSKENHLYSYGAYLTGDFKLDNLRGADILSSWWYNRNLRIFRKIQKIKESANDRILVIFGNGHAAILRQLFSCSPEFKFIEFNSLND